MLRRLRQSKRYWGNVLILILVLDCSARISNPVAVNQSFDVVVYGGTATGVMAAVAAAREGVTVALVEPGNHLGGMVSGGLGYTELMISLILWEEKNEILE